MVYVYAGAVKVTFLPFSCDFGRWDGGMDGNEENNLSSINFEVTWFYNYNLARN